MPSVAASWYSVDFSQKASVIMQMLIRYLSPAGGKKKKTTLRISVVFTENLVSCLYNWTKQILLLKMTYYLSGHFILSFWEGQYVTKDTTGPWVRNWLWATRENLRPLKTFLFLSCGAVTLLPSSNGIFWISCYNARPFWNSTRTLALL